MKPVVVFSNSSPGASSAVAVIGTPGSSWMFAGACPSEKKRQPAAVSNALILILAAASVSDIAVMLALQLRLRAIQERIHYGR
jgi:hypothetical protein